VTEPPLPADEIPQPSSILNTSVGPPSGPPSGPPAGPPSAEDRLWTLLAYIFSPVVPLILQLIEEKKNNPFIRQHNAQALALGVLQVALAVIAPVTFCLSGVAGILLFLAQVYWGLQAYSGQEVRIPVISDFVARQGWV